MCGHTLEVNYLDTDRGQQHVIAMKGSWLSMAEKQLSEKVIFNFISTGFLLISICESVIGSIKYLLYSKKGMIKMDGFQGNL